MLWADIEPEVRRMLEPDLSADDVDALEKQEKRLRTLIEEIKQIEEGHVRTLRLQRRRTAARKEVDPVVEALRSGDVGAVAGRDMAGLVRLLRKDNAFVNKTLIDSEIANERKIMAEFVNALQKRVQDCKQDLEDARSLPVEVDAGSLDGTVVVRNGSVAVQSEGAEQWRAVMLRQPIADDKYFRVEITDGSLDSFRIGVGVYGLTDFAAADSAKNALSVGADGTLRVDGRELLRGFGIGYYQTVTVLQSQETIRWELDGQPICEAAIPAHLTARKLYPLCWVRSDRDKDKVSRIRFI